MLLRQCKSIETARVRYASTHLARIPNDSNPASKTLRDRYQRLRFLSIVPTSLVPLPISSTLLRADREPGPIRAPSSSRGEVVWGRRKSSALESEDRVSKKLAFARRIK